MKIKVLFVLLIFLAGITPAQNNTGTVHQNEVDITISNASGSISVEVYQVNSSKETECIRSGSIANGSTGSFSVEGVNGSSPNDIFSPLPADVAEAGVYLVIGDIYMPYSCNSQDYDLHVTYNV